MITYEQALSANEFWHMTLKNADGTPMRCRRNGKTKTWKTRPGVFRIPVKYGLKQCFNIDNFNGDLANYNNAHEWCVPERWDVEHQLFAGVTPE